ncbi:hypothetical protein F0562_017864 [Nyssa sinensis]|uniref:Uncharacterized protein n=1 Tax=Nyssa sinensis TaxID=561372 RepID=A0A5J4ZIX4_9ASTE|nr:hypothetical protein F0562_017864 [Nyssa sinensis]
MQSSSSDLPQKSFQIKQDNKVFSRLLSKESAMANPSFRVYYAGVSGAVPFLWESQPGTPKYKFCDTTVPPLTPPPSYYFNNDTKPKKYSRSKFLDTLFLRINLKKPHLPSSPSLSSSSSSSGSSSHLSMFLPATPSNNFKGRNRFLSQRTSFDDKEPGTFGSPNSTLCFKIGRDSTNGRLRGFWVRGVPSYYKHQIDN